MTNSLKNNIISIYIEINNIWFIEDYGILSNLESFILYNTLKKKLIKILKWADETENPAGKLIGKICISIKALISKQKKDVFPFYNKPLFT
ncbi:MAG: hypothetical protein ACTSRG_27430, partial [Candidatus Helarchaeota archaeon]